MSRLDAALRTAREREVGDAVHGSGLGRDEVYPAARSLVDVPPAEYAAAYYGGIRPHSWWDQHPEGRNQDRDGSSSDNIRGRHTALKGFPPLSRLSPPS